MVQRSPLKGGIPAALDAQTVQALETMAAKARENRYPPLDERRADLLRLAEALDRHESSLLTALAVDFGKPVFEAYFAEIDQVRAEIKGALKNLAGWMRRRRLGVPLQLAPTRAYEQSFPRGVALIISPWNYPVHLSLMPLVGAIAAGNRAIVKPSELTAATATALTALVREALPMDKAMVVCGDTGVSQQLLDTAWDVIFFTGSTRVGRIVYEKAARNLTPVVLELGGKSPAVVRPDADLNLTAKRVIWGKGLNSGQTCVAPDLLFVPDRLVQELIPKLLSEISRQWVAGEAAGIISRQHWERLQSMLDECPASSCLRPEAIEQESPGRAPDALAAGNLRMGLTLVLNPPATSRVMTEEIFGPILPVLTYGCDADLMEKLRRFCPDPLAAYFFGRDAGEIEGMMHKLRFGGGCINDAIVHLGVKGGAFGGIGTSGMGNYRGRHSFEAFSHVRTIARTPALELPTRYPPYAGKFKFLRRISRWL